MNSNLLFDFIVDKENNTIRIKREFNANLELVWQAWTEPELLDQWWGPKPYKTRTKTMDFREGGMWLYEMYNTENVEQNESHWCKNDYHKIEHQKNFSGLDAFCDENGTVNTNMPRTLWTNNFTEYNGITTVNMLLKHDKLEDLEKMIEMGFKDGLSIGLNQLDKLLSTLKK